MIVFLTLCYVAILAAAIKFGVIKLNLFWKLSPILWMVALFIVLFLPMQWGAPGGSVNVYQYVVEVIPNVSGEVTEVPVKPLVPLQRGDVLFRIDPVPFQAKVDQLKAQLESTTHNVQQLKAEADAAAATVKGTEEQINIQKSDVEAAAAKLVVAETAVDRAQTGVERSTQLVEDLTTQVAAAKREFDRRKDLLAQNAGSKSEVDKAEVQYTSLASQLNVSNADLRTAKETLNGTKASLDAERATARSVDLTLKQLVEAELPRSKANERQARIAANSMIGDVHTSVATVRAQLVNAQFDLDNTVVRAPADGHVMAVALRPGQRVANLPLRSWMPFIDHEQSEIIVAVQQYALRNVQPGQDAEVTFKLFPGKVFSATVDRIAYTNPAGQFQPSGQLTSKASNFQQTHPYGVVLKLNDDEMDQATLAGGATGSAAIYTDSMQATHVIRKVMIRMDSWMNYIVP